MPPPYTNGNRSRGLFNLFARQKARTQPSLSDVEALFFGR
jgi:hypothetical protein